MPPKSKLSNPVADFNPTHWNTQLREVILFLAWLFAAIIVAVYVVGICVVGTKLYSAIHATGSEAAADARLSMIVFLALLGAPIVVWRAIEQSRQVEISRNAQYSDTFTRAVEQLGATRVVEETVADKETKQTQRNIEVRLGAIYALERLMHARPDEAGPIVETLSAYIRENCKDPVDALAAGMNVDLHEGVTPMNWRYEVLTLLRNGFKNTAPGDFPDIQAALVVLGRRPTKIGPPMGPNEFSSADLTGSNLQGVIFVQKKLTNLRLMGARLAGAMFSNCCIDDSDLTGLEFYAVDANSSSFRGARLDLINARGSNFSHADLSGASVRFATLAHAEFYGTKLKGALLIGDFSSIRHDEQFMTEVSKAFGHKISTTLPKGAEIPDHWSTAATEADYMAEWAAFKRQVGVD